MYTAEKIGPLETIEIPGSRDAPCVVLLHGYGADANDLAPLSHVWKMPTATTWLIPNGPLKIPIGPHSIGRAWAPINMEEWQRAMMEGRPRDLSADRPPELLKSKELVLEMMKARGIKIENTIFIGFSQGAMLATHIALTSDVSPLGLVILSGSLVNAEEWKKEGIKRKGLKFFQSHGLHDDVLSIQGAERLEKVLVEDCKMVGELLKFEGAHDIPNVAIVGTQDYLLQLLPDAK